MTMLAQLGKSKFGQAVIAFVVIGACILSIFELRRVFGRDPAIVAANERIFICSETHKPFTVHLEDLIGQTAPFESPYTHTKTGYPAELCYWTADGKPKSEPTAVLMNTWIHQPEPTFCPDCGRLVVANNPMAVAGHTPPPTREEWEARHSH
jgi:hypothetical protein